MGAAWDGEKASVIVSRKLELEDVSLRVPDHSWYPTKVLV